MSSNSQFHNDVVTVRCFYEGIIHIKNVIYYLNSTLQQLLMTAASKAVFSRNNLKILSKTQSYKNLKKLF